MARSNQVPTDILDKYTSLVNDMLSHIPKDLRSVKTKKELSIYKRFVRLAKASAKNSKSKKLQLLVIKREADIIEQEVKIEKTLYERALKRHANASK